MQFLVKCLLRVLCEIQVGLCLLKILQLEGMRGASKQYGQQISLTSQKIKSFQKSIRRDELLSFFSEQRKVLIDSLFNAPNKHPSPLSLDVVEKRNQYVRNMYAFFRSQPMLNWREKIQELTSFIGYFEGDFRSWIEFNLTPTLVEIFKHGEGLTEIQVLIAKLFTAQICNSNPKTCISNAYISDSLIADNLVILLKTNRYQCHQKICFLTLLAQISSLSNTIRDRLVKIGVGEILSSFVDELLAKYIVDEQMVLMFLGCCQLFCKVFKRRNLLYFPQVSFALEMITVLLKLISRQTRTNILESSLQCLYTILKNKADVLITKMVYEKPDIFEDLLFFLTNGELRTKEMVLNLYRVIGLIHPKVVSTYIHHVHVFDCVQLQMERAQTTRSFIITSLKAIEMILNNKSSAISLLGHQLGKIVIQLLKSHQSDIKKAAFGVIVQATGYLQQSPNQLSLFIKEYNLLPLLVTQISDLSSKSCCVQDALILIERYIQDNAEHNKDFNQAIYNLQTHYNLMNLLETLLYQNGQGYEYERIRERAGKLIDVMVNHYTNDCL